MSKRRLMMSYLCHPGHSHGRGRARSSTRQCGIKLIGCIAALGYRSKRCDLSTVKMRMSRSILLWIGVEIHRWIVRLGLLISLFTSKHEEPQYERNECQADYADYDANDYWDGVSGMGRGCSHIWTGGITGGRRIGRIDRTEIRIKERFDDRPVEIKGVEGGTSGVAEVGH